MDTNTLFTMALGLQAPWEVKNLQFNEEAKRLDIAIDFTRGADFPCPVCGQPAKVHDTEEKTWRHLDFFQHSAYLTARVPRCKCDVDGVKQVQVPWARPGSGFTLLFEALVMALVKVMPVAVVARLVKETDTRIWRLAHHHVDEALAKVDMSEVTRIGIDETAAKRGQNYITLVMDMVAKKLLFGVEGRSHATLAAFKADFLAHKGDPAKIEEVCLDMSPSFIKGLRVHFPKAHLTFDRFHVMQMINKAVDEVRRGEAKDRPELKKTRYIWLKNASNLKANQVARLQELRDALASVKVLQGLIPICSSCKKIRNDQGYWTKLEIYLQEHADVTFSHGICLDCLRKLYPDLCTEVEMRAASRPTKTHNA